MTAPEDRPLWRLEEQLAGVVGVPVQRGVVDGERAAAVLSQDTPATYRYLLTRQWDPRLPIAVWGMLNPSIATGLRNDFTINKCRGFTCLWGCGGMVVWNLFGLVSTDPRALLRHPDPIGPHNDQVLTACTFAGVRRGGPVVAAWGTKGALQGRGREVASRLSAAGVALACLTITKGGHPGHPERLPWASELRPYPVA